MQYVKQPTKPGSSVQMYAFYKEAEGKIPNIHEQKSIHIISDLEKL